MIALLLCASGIISVSVAYPAGPPLEACMSMFPQHLAPPSAPVQTQAQTTASPFIITVSKNTFIAGDEITVTVQPGPNSSEGHFNGVFVQARLANCSVLDPIGTFKLAANETYLKLNPCMQKNDSAVSHSTKQEHSNVTFTWVAPAGSPGHIFFTATAVHEYTTFWIDIQSQYLNDTTSMEPFPGSKCVTVVPGVPAWMMSTTPGTTAPTGTGNIVCACWSHAMSLLLLALIFFQ